jgi:hypothetical protein
LHDYRRRSWSEIGYRWRSEGGWIGMCIRRRFVTWRRKSHSGHCWRVLCRERESEGFRVRKWRRIRKFCWDGFGRKCDIRNSVT